MIKEIRNKKRKGFSLVELIVVIAIIGILAAIAVPKYSAYKDNANKRVDEVTSKLLAEAALMAYEAGELNDEVSDTGALSDSDLADVWSYVKGDKDTKAKTGGSWIISFSHTGKVIDSTGTITVKSTNITHTVDY